MIALSAPVKLTPVEPEQWADIAHAHAHTADGCFDTAGPSLAVMEQFTLLVYFMKGKARLYIFIASNALLKFNLLS